VGSGGTESYISSPIINTKDMKSTRWEILVLWITTLSVLTMSCGNPHDKMAGTWEAVSGTIEISIIDDIPVLKIGHGPRERSYPIRTDKKPMTVTISRYDTTWDIIYDDGADILYVDGEQFKRVKR
jgi:hypothetical protein